MYICTLFIRNTLVKRYFDKKYCILFIPREAESTKKREIERERERK